MMAVGELVLILGLLASAHCKVRPRDPGVEEEESGEHGGRAGVGDLYPDSSATPSPGDGGNFLARSGNWCRFVHKHTMTTAVKCGMEVYTIKSQSPCPSGSPGCHLILYKQSNRPRYRQEPKIVTSLLWRCCPGYGGDNCDDAVPRSSAEQLRPAGVYSPPQQLHGDPNREQNDFHDFVGTSHDAGHAKENQQNATHSAPQPGHTYNPHQTTSQPGHDHNPHHPATHPGHALNPHHPATHPGHALNPHHPATHPGHALNPHHPATHPGHALNPHHPATHPGHAYNPHQPAPQPDHNPHHTGKYQHLPTVVEEGQMVVVPYPDMATALLVPHVMALVMSQLQPVLDGFNRSLEDLSRQVALLKAKPQTPSQDKAGEPQTPSQDEAAEPQTPSQDEVARPQTPSQDEAAEPQTPSQDEAAEPQTPSQDEAAEPQTPSQGEVAEEELQLASRLEEAFQHIRDVRRQLELQRSATESRLHSQHAMLHYNLTSFKTDIDMKLKRHQKMLQISLQAMNATLSELKLEQDLGLGQDRDQDRDRDQDQDRDWDQDRDQDWDRDQDPLAVVWPVERPPPSLPSSEASALWEAITRLDNVVVNNTIKVDGLLEDTDVTAGRVQRLRLELKVLDERINRTGRHSQVLFMETGLEVEAAKVAVLSRVGELAGNLSLQGQRLQEMDVDVDYLYTTIYRHNASDCDCQALQAGLARLERGVANVTELANDNRMALEEEGGDGAEHWEPVVEVLQRSLQQVKESLASEQTRSGRLDSGLARLSGSVSAVESAVSDLRVVNQQLVADRNHLLGSFNSLLSDTIRHSDVLDLLLGEEVLDFLEWAEPEQEAYAVPTLREQLRQLQQQLGRLNLSLSSALGLPLGRDEVPSADQPSYSSSSSSSSWPMGGGAAPARERQLLLSDGGDLWRLEKTVEELKLQLLEVEERSGQQAALQAEVTWLKRGLEEHLRVFKNVFSNADVLAGTDATLELDKLWQLLRSKDEKKEKKRRGGGGSGGTGATHRSKRALAGPPTSSSSQIMFSGSPRGVSGGLVLFDARLNRHHFYSDAGTFTAPVGGVYQFTLTLSLQSGAAHLDLQRSSGGAATPLLRTAGPGPHTAQLWLRKGEGLRLELRRGMWAESRENALEVALLLRRHT